MVKRTKPVQIKFHLSEDKAAKLEQYLATADKKKQDIFESFVDMLIASKK